jgi:SAM-dependent methyltransferase
MVEQKQVTQFYDSLLFPSRTSHPAYRELVPTDLQNKIVGDFGCGQSLFQETFRMLGYQALFLDISWNVVSHIDYGKKVQASLTSLPLKSNCMDAIFCIGVVHHIPEMEEAIRELVRVLRPKGRLYLGVYTDRCVQAHIRKMYDSTNNAVIKKAIYSFAGLLIWIRNRKNKLKFRSIDYYKRIDDLLITPLVRYLPSDFYKKILERCGAEAENIKRISSMNILIVNKLNLQ